MSSAVLGIDLGTTTCIAAFCDMESDQDPVPVRLLNGSFTFPSVLCCDLKRGRVSAVFTGQEALSKGENVIKEVRELSPSWISD